MVKKIVTVVGARPNFIKSALLSKALKGNFQEIVIHTGQHYDLALSDSIFKDLNLKLPQINLKVGSGTHGEQTGKMLIRLEKELVRISPDAVIVIGDTNSSLAGALAAAKLNIFLIHLEAGERTNIKTMPEEMNRIICDHLADVSLCATTFAVENLKREAIDRNVFWVGDVMYDLFKTYKSKVKKPGGKFPQKFALFTVHRAENTNDHKKLLRIINGIGALNLPVVWPIHPRTKKLVQHIKLPNNIFLIPPATYSEMLWLESQSSFIITDSGGVQKEAYWWGVPCLTLMEDTAWKETLRGGWNKLVQDPLDISDLVSTNPKGKPKPDVFGNGEAYKSIRLILKKVLNEG